MTSALEAFKKARARIQNPENWCQGNYALTVDGKPCHPTSEEAVKFCIIGALKAEDYIPACIDAWIKLNDRSTHEYLLARLNGFIAELEQDVPA